MSSKLSRLQLLDNKSEKKIVLLKNFGYQLTYGIIQVNSNLMLVLKLLE
jgi:hypothetical protein